MDSDNASIFTRTSAGVFLPPTLTRCSDSQTYSAVAFLEPPNTKLCRHHAQFPYRSHLCLGLFLKNNVDVHPSFACSNHGNPGSCLISHIHWFRTFKLLKLSALLSPYFSNVRPHSSQRTSCKALSLQSPPHPSLDPTECRPMNIRLVKDQASTRQASR